MNIVSSMLNPLKSDKITFTEMKIITKMKELGKWKNGDELKRIDSLVESAYNTEQNLHW
jgi:hypothetical protein